MSGVPKRPHEEASGGQKRPHDDSASGLYTGPTSKPIQPGGSADYHVQHDHMQDAARFPKVPRIESREEKRPAAPPSFMQKPGPAFPPLSDHLKSSPDVVEPPAPAKGESGTVARPDSTKVEETEAKGHVRVSGMSSWGFPVNPSSEEPAKSLPATEDNINTGTKPAKKDLNEKEAGPVLASSEQQGGPQERKRERETDPAERQRNKREEGGSSLPAQGQITASEPEKEKEGGFGVHQRRRQVRSRASPNSATHREPRFRSSRLRDDGVQVKSEQSAVVYKAGECMQELLKSWEEFEASTQEAKNGESSHGGPTLEIRIPSEYVTSTNRQC